MYVHVHSNPYNYSNHSVRMVLGMFDNFQLQYCVEATLLHCIQHISISLHWIMEHAIFAIHALVHTHTHTHTQPHSNFIKCSDYSKAAINNFSLCFVRCQFLHVHCTCHTCQYYMNTFFMAITIFIYT